jgi:ubiquinone biosynthesis protein UbiJ
MTFEEQFQEACKQAREDCSLEEIELRIGVIEERLKINQFLRSKCAQVKLRDQQLLGEHIADNLPTTVDESEIYKLMAEASELERERERLQGLILKGDFAKY